MDHPAVVVPWLQRSQLVVGVFAPKKISTKTVSYEMSELHHVQCLVVFVLLGEICP